VHFTDAWRWKQVPELCLARYGRHQDELNEEHPLLVSLPDDVFHRIVAFVVPPAFQLLPEHGYEKIWCNCSKMSPFGECHARSMRGVVPSPVVELSSWEIRGRRLLRWFCRNKMYVNFAVKFAGEIETFAAKVFFCRPLLY
jgi:hypothetical protein